MAKTETTHPTSMNKRTRARLFGLGIGLLVFTVTTGILAGTTAAHPTIASNVRVGEVDISNMTPEQAAQKLAERFQTYTSAIVTIDDGDHVITLAELGLVLNPEKTARRAYEETSAGNRLQVLIANIRSRIAPITMPAEFDANEEQLTARIQALVTEVTKQEKNASLTYDDGQWSVVESTVGAAVTAVDIRDVIFETVRGLGAKSKSLTSKIVKPKVTTVEAETLIPLAQERSLTPIVLTVGSETIILDPEQFAPWVTIYPDVTSKQVTLALAENNVSAYAKTLADRFNLEPVEARVIFKDGGVQITQDSRDGRVLNEKQTVQAITTAYTEPAQRTVALPFAENLPSVSSKTLATLGLKELIGTAATSFVGSPSNRKHNIQVGTQFLTGKLIKPGEEFSVIGALGTIDKTTGYLPELVIKENETIPEYGGGLCQVSTTLFRAAMNTGLKITARKNHSYRVPYYERGIGPGLDATIYYPNPDLKFLNDMEGWILIQGTVDMSKNLVTFELYGTKDGRRGVIDGPYTLSSSNPPPDVLIETASLPQGVRKQTDHAHPGAKTVATYKVYRGEELLFTQTFHSNYKPWPAKFLVGTGTPVPSSVTEPSPSSEPTPTPSPTPSESPTPAETQEVTPAP